MGIVRPTIFNLRGPSGSGKSTIGHAFLDEFPGEEIYEDGWNKTKPRLCGYRLPGGLEVLGSYRAAGGGMDTFSPHNRSDALELVRRHARDGARFIFFEALVISSTVPAYADLARELASTHDFVFGFMDTPIETCLENVYKRNGGKQIKEDNIRTHHKYMSRVRDRLVQEGLKTVPVHYPDGYEEIKAELALRGWRP